MEKVKVLIHIDGGNVQVIASNTKDVDIVIVDIDNQDAGDDPVTLCYHQVVEDFRVLYPFNDPSDEEIKNRLKEVGFALK